MSALVWFRRDLRLADHPALVAALAASDDVVPVFCFDDRLLHGRHASGVRTQFLLDCLAELAAGLRERGSRLLLRHGPPERELPRLAREAGARWVHFSADVSPFARQRARRVHRALIEAGSEPVAHPGLAAVDDLAATLTAKGEPYTMFSPFHRSWAKQPRRRVLAAPSGLPSPPSRLRTGRLPTLGGLGLASEAADPIRGGERHARELLDAFLDGPVNDYRRPESALREGGSSRLSAHLHLGAISPRQVESRLGRTAGAQAFRRQLAWRDFLHHVLLHHPENARLELQRRYRKLEWRNDPSEFDAWRTGQTGYPLVDAAMRQLAREGWMPNRARLVVASFLTKDLAIDWRWGERHFMRLLVDGDEANNNGNWQWIASVGVDPQPAYRRLYNPARHQERFDPDGSYVRRWVAELEPVPDRYLREPWTMPAEIQREVGCVIGRDYPEPIVDHLEARREALARYRGG